MQVIKADDSQAHAEIEKAEELRAAGFPPAATKAFLESLDGVPEIACEEHHTTAGALETVYVLHFPLCLREAIAAVLAGERQGLVSVKE